MVLRKNVIRECSKGIKEILEHNIALEDQDNWTTLVIDLIDILKSMSDFKICTTYLVRSNYGHIANVCNYIKFFLRTEVTSQILGKIKDRETELENVLKDKIDIDKKLSDSAKDQSEYVRMKSIFPDISDIHGEPPSLSPIRKTGGYSSFKEYMHVQYSLLREDFVGPLRDEIQYYRKMKQNTENWDNNTRFSDIRIYQRVRIVSLVCDHGLNYVVTFDTSTLRKVNWSTSGRLKYGSLVCLSVDDFDSMLVGTVCDSIPNARRDGYLYMEFDPSIDEQKIRAAMRMTHTMIEAVAYFEAYRHVLLKCKQLTKADLAMSRYIINCETRILPPSYLQKFPRPTFDLSSIVDPDFKISGFNAFEPFMREDFDHTYIDRPFRRGKSTSLNSSYVKDELNEDAGALGEESVQDSDNELKSDEIQLKQVNVVEQEWHEMACERLDNSQLQAIMSALKCELSIIQGPPGCGKTFIGKEIIKILLNNEKIWRTTKRGEPILVLCYTNHALDQFLEGICDFYNGGILRVGGRSNSDKLRSRNLLNIRTEMRKARSIPDYIYHGKKSEKSKLIKIRKDQKMATTKIQILRENIIHERSLYQEMGPDITNQFEWKRRDTQKFSTVTNNSIESMIHIWLGIEEISKDIEYSIQQNGIDQIKNMDARKQTHDESDEFPEIHSASRYSMLDNDIKFDEKDLEKEVVSFTNENVALTIADIGKKPLFVSDGQWKILRWHRLELTKRLQDQLRRQERIDTEPAPGINIDNFNFQQRWNLYNHWVDKKCEKLTDEIEKSVDEYISTFACYEEITMLENRYIMKMADVIGMTTTGAAKHRKELQEVNPKIIIVEEAAEILESHLVSNFSKSCEQLILIGDHQQLRPKPNYYKLEKDFSLDISLFERLILSKMKYTTLSEQHRMRSLIAENVRKIYPEIKDHQSVLDYEDVKGMEHNMVFLKHNHMESSTSDSRSHRNTFEASFCIKLAIYLVQQGYTPDQVTILTTYKGQMFDIMKLKRQEKVLQGVNVTAVDNFQGEESDIIILSLVRSNHNGRIGFLSKANRICVALSRAKLGMYVLGNFDMYKTDLWKTLINSLTNKSLVLPAIPLKCQNHPYLEPTRVSSAEDFDSVHEGGCKRPCHFKMSCGHICRKTCHLVDIEHKQVFCEMPCERQCKNGHPCQQRCGEECRCTVTIEIIPPCGHKTKVKCFEQDSFECSEVCKRQLECGHICQKLCKESCRPCKESVILLLPRCGHLITRPCHTDLSQAMCQESCNLLLDCGHRCRERCFSSPNDKESQNNLSECILGHLSSCKEKCHMVLECGHICSGTCSDCFQGRLHKPCQERCKHALICGHRCLGTCSSCLPCQQPCKKFCPHKKCGRRCNEICEQCTEPCVWQCKHYRCTMVCGQPCNRPRCNRRCPERLKCGHRCIGLCGEPCIRFCPLCTKKAFEDNCFGGRQFPYSSFVQLDDCGHAVEYRLLDKYFDDCNEKTILRQCPICSTPIYHCRRYGQILNELLKNIDRMKMNLLFGGYLNILSDFNSDKTLKDNLIALNRMNIETLRQLFLSFIGNLQRGSPDRSPELFVISEIYFNRLCFIAGREESATTPCQQWRENYRNEVYRSCDLAVIMCIENKITDLTEETKQILLSAKEILLSRKPYDSERRQITIDIVHTINQDYMAKFELVNVNFEIQSFEQNRNLTSSGYSQDSESESSFLSSERQSEISDFDSIFKQREGDDKINMEIEFDQPIEFLKHPRATVTPVSVEDSVQSPSAGEVTFESELMQLDSRNASGDLMTLNSQTMNLQNADSESKMLSSEMVMIRNRTESNRKFTPQETELPENLISEHGLVSNSSSAPRHGSTVISSSCFEQDSLRVLALPKNIVLYTMPCPEYYTCDILPFPEDFKRTLTIRSSKGRNDLSERKQEKKSAEKRCRSRSRRNASSEQKQENTSVKKRCRSRNRDRESSKRWHEEKRRHKSTSNRPTLRHDKYERRNPSNSRGLREENRLRNNRRKSHYQSQSKQIGTEKDRQTQSQTLHEVKSRHTDTKVVKKAGSNFTYQKIVINTDDKASGVSRLDQRHSSYGDSKGRELVENNRSTHRYKVNIISSVKLHKSEEQETETRKDKRMTSVLSCLGKNESIESIYTKANVDSGKKQNSNGNDCKIDMNHLQVEELLVRNAEAKSSKFRLKNNEKKSNFESYSINYPEEVFKKDITRPTTKKAKSTSPIAKVAMDTKTFEHATKRVVIETDIEDRKTCSGKTMPISSVITSEKGEESENCSTRKPKLTEINELVKIVDETNSEISCEKFNITMEREKASIDNQMTKGHDEHRFTTTGEENAMSTRHFSFLKKQEPSRDQPCLNVRIQKGRETLSYQNMFDAENAKKGTIKCITDFEQFG